MAGRCNYREVELGCGRPFSPPRLEARGVVARAVTKSELVIVEQAGQLPFVEEQRRCFEVVRNLLVRRPYGAAFRPFGASIPKLKNSRHTNQHYGRWSIE